MGRYGRADVSLPGAAQSAPGREPSRRGTARDGPDIGIENGNIRARASRLRGARIVLDTVTVTGTENLMMAAALANGESVIENAAREPEVVDLADFLVKLGAVIEGAGTNTIHIQGVDNLGGANYTVLPDRIESGTYLVAGAITGGRIRINRDPTEPPGCRRGQAGRGGAFIRSGADWIALDMQESAPGGGSAHFAPSRFPHRLQAQSAPSTPSPRAPASSPRPCSRTASPRAWNSALGADLSIEGNTVISRGVPDLTGRTRHGHRPARLALPGSGWPCGIRAHGY